MNTARIDDAIRSRGEKPFQIMSDANTRGTSTATNNDLYRSLLTGGNANQVLDQVINNADDNRVAKGVSLIKDSILGNQYLDDRQKRALTEQLLRDGQMQDKARQVAIEKQRKEEELANYKDKSSFMTDMYDRVLGKFDPGVQGIVDKERKIQQSLYAELKRVKKDNKRTCTVSKANFSLSGELESADSDTLFGRVHGTQDYTYMYAILPPSSYQFYVKLRGVPDNTVDVAIYADSFVPLQDVKRDVLFGGDGRFANYITPAFRSNERVVTFSKFASGNASFKLKAWYGGMNRYFDSYSKDETDYEMITVGETIGYDCYTVIARIPSEMVNVVNFSVTSYYLDGKIEAYGDSPLIQFVNDGDGSKTDTQKRTAYTYFMDIMKALRKQNFRVRKLIDKMSKRRAKQFLDKPTRYANEIRQYLGGDSSI